ncbi:SNAPIN protein homolog isoform X2 [Daktulosphaira vitifoliae]|uniref:SNAPIN protein homolog isoform X2 n=1 Tax=Daktulosphaira vitifoliae TaxID=58002 RepID=UPI0021AAE74F|nr:SNAPIN protein homolog isoform X2 [Daktulosphaira vitifoliae]
MDLDQQEQDLEDTNSNCSVTAVDDITTGDQLQDDFCVATRDTLADGITSLLKPAIDRLDATIQCTRLSQLDLKLQLDSLASELKQLSLVQHYKSSISSNTSSENSSDSLPNNLDKYCTRLVNTRLKITVVGNILETTQERLKNLSAKIDREQNKRRSLLEPNTPQINKPFQQEEEPNIEDIINEIKIGNENEEELNITSEEEYQ